MGRQLTALLEAWRALDTTRLPYILAGDEIIRDERWSCSFGSWNAYVGTPNFGEPGASRFHVDLLPVPYSGAIGTASIFLLMLNPGLGPHDYFAEYEVPEFRKARVQNLRQEGQVHNFDLDPRFSWHGGFQYWHGRLSDLISSFAASVGKSYGDSRRVFAKELAAVELVPYHSRSFALAGSQIESLESVRLAKGFVQTELRAKARDGDCLIIVTRAANRWGLSEEKNIVVYSGVEARSAYLTQNSPGGKRILDFLVKKYRRTR